MLNIIHISDLHIKDYDSNIKTSNIIDNIVYRCKNRDYYSLIIITGDITDNGTKHEFIRFKDEIMTMIEKEKKILVAITPGNHDIVSLGNQFGWFTDVNHMLKSVRHFQKVQDYVIKTNKDKIQMNVYNYFTDSIRRKILFFNTKSKVKKLLKVVEFPTEKTVLFLLDSNPTIGLDFNFARGEIGKKQLSKLTTLLTKYKTWYRIVALHHHPIYNGLSGVFLKLEDSDEFMQVIWDNTELVLAGHKHVWNLQSTHSGYISFAASTRYFKNSFDYTTFMTEYGVLIKYQTGKLY